MLHGVYIQKSHHISLLVLINTLDSRGIFGSANNATCILCRGFCTLVLFIVAFFSASVNRFYFRCTIYLCMFVYCSLPQFYIYMSLMPMVSYVFIGTYRFKHIHSLSSYTLSPRVFLPRAHKYYAHAVQRRA